MWGGTGHQNLPPPVPLSPASRTFFSFISRLPLSGQANSNSFPHRQRSSLDPDYPDYPRPKYLRFMYFDYFLSPNRNNLAISSTFETQVIRKIKNNKTEEKLNKHSFFNIIYFFIIFYGLPLPVHQGSRLPPFSLPPPVPCLPGSRPPVPPHSFVSCYWFLLL